MSDSAATPDACRPTRPLGRSKSIAAALLMILLAAACASPTPSSGKASEGGSKATAAGDSAGRLLTMVTRYEVTHLIPKARTTANPATAKRPFNASLIITDSNGNSRPYLAEAQPQLNTDAWQVFPDGHMQTTYPLRRNLTWHDGEPLTADDFVFSWQVYSTPSLGGIFGST